MNRLQRLVAWVFALEAVAFLGLALVAVWGIARAAPSGEVPSLSDRVHGVVLLAGLVTLGTLWGLGWWTCWKRQPRGRAWALVASVANLGFAFAVPVLGKLPLAAQAGVTSERPVWEIALAGVVGLVAFRDRRAW